MKKIFILTGEPSGDKLASKVIVKLKSLKPGIDYLSVGGEHLKSLEIKSLYDLKEITYLGFTKVLLNIFKIKKKINETVDKIIELGNDGIGKEILLAEYWGQVITIDSDGSPLPGWQYDMGNQIWGTPAIGDLNGNGENEICNETLIKRF